LQAFRAQVQFRASKLWLRKKMMILSVPPKITGPSSATTWWALYSYIAAVWQLFVFPATYRYTARA